MDSLDYKKIIRFNETQNKAIRKVMQEYHYDKIVKNPENWKYIMPTKALGNDFAEYLTRRGGKRYKGAMYTINCKPDTEVHKLMSVMKSIQKYTCFEECSYCVEWRHENEGMHGHMLMIYQKGEDVYSCTQRVRRGCKHIIKCNQHVNVRYSNQPENFEKYLQGIKKGKPKSTHKCTMFMREMHQLDDMY